MSKQWAGASVTYTGQGTYSVGSHKFRPNRTVPVDDPKVMKLIRAIPLFKIKDHWVGAPPEPEVEPDQPEPTLKPRPKVKKKAPVKKTKKVKKTGAGR